MHAKGNAEHLPLAEIAERTRGRSRMISLAGPNGACDYVSERWVGLTGKEWRSRMVRGPWPRQLEWHGRGRPLVQGGDERERPRADGDRLEHAQSGDRAQLEIETDQSVDSGGRGRARTLARAPPTVDAWPIRARTAKTVFVIAVGISSWRL